MLKKRCATRRVVGTCLVTVALVMLAPTVSYAAPQGNPGQGQQGNPGQGQQGNPGQGQQGNPGQGRQGNPESAPEIDVGSAAGALTIAAGVLAILRERVRRPSA